METDSPSASWAFLGKATHVSLEMEAVFSLSLLQEERDFTLLKIYRCRVVFNMNDLGEPSQHQQKASLSLSPVYGKIGRRLIKWSKLTKLPLSLGSSDSKSRNTFHQIRTPAVVKSNSLFLSTVSVPFWPSQGSVHTEFRDVRFRAYNPCSFWESDLCPL